MMRKASFFIVLLLGLAGCSLPVAVPPTFEPDSPAVPTTTSVAGPQLRPGTGESIYWVTNPASGADLYVRAFYPASWNGNELLPALVAMPGGIATSDPVRAARLAEQGYLVVIFDADGRGQSGGVEDYNGFITQDGLAAVIQAAASLPGLDATRFGLVSYSFGVTAATGVLARHPDLPIRFYIDWEGPVDRMYTTTGCGLNRPEGIQWQPCSQEAWWAEREAVVFIENVQVPYQRIQSEQDHVQLNNDHAIDILNAAVAGGVPWVRLNEYPPDQTYDLENPPAMLPEEMDRRLEQTIARYADYILENVLAGRP